MQRCAMACVVTVGLAGFAAGATPAEWLKPDGRSPEWVAATAKCRELLGKVGRDYLIHILYGL